MPTIADDGICVVGFTHPTGFRRCAVTGTPYPREGWDAADALLEVIGGVGNVPTIAGDGICVVGFTHPTGFRWCA
jgi:hypothetical protein